MAKSSLKLGRNVLLLLSCFLLIFMLFPETSAAQTELLTQYPSVSATAGESVTFPIRIKNSSSQSELVNLAISSQPEGWYVALRGKERNIQQVLVEGQDSETVDLKISLPENVEVGNYPITITGTSSRGQKSQLNLYINVSEGRQGDDALAARYVELKGPNDATFNFRLSLTNNGGSEQLYSLGAQLEPGWQASFTPSGETQQVASISVKPGETKNIDVKVKPPITAKEGEYTIPVEAISPTSRVTETLKVIISGTYNLELSTSSGRLNADVIAGRETKINLEVINNGSAVLNNINFSSSQPKNWAVTFEPDTVETLQPGESRQITATITADAKAISGDYIVSLSATTSEAKSSADLRVTVKTSTLWGLVGVIIIIGVVAALYQVFRKYGRR
jgi:uncharacterized membrane protein